MPPKPKRQAALSQADLHRLAQLQAQVALAAERLSHTRTQGRLAQAHHEAAVLRLSHEHNAQLRQAEGREREALADLQAAKDGAQDFARSLGESYAVDLQKHAVDPLTGAFVQLPEGIHG